ncbi:winged helix-turn-helix transcriptional regulator [Bosea sp. (in: a-proteobacteria)]|uniref:winged helix-turn-helix transcriptional regulator n=1 Tax=Bosea sp. (in: a-proteobacteria) TaxID=1871050 RepID=UPI002622E690|nr:winged helix-turn-helix transcriptional regulator [Bosea sp. (in: a-proteobacteria)]MCO5090648.1 winged helix-turn-helix transcriptional regulator [Bosea sp. (in: a-proteobacteria)]
MVAGSNNAAAVGGVAPGPDAAHSEGRHIAGLLAFVEREAHVSQRALASELGVALGLVNTYVKRCVKKGLIKVQHVPSRRYAYYLTPSGFAEKSRLTAEYLSWSLSFFRRARSECSALFEEARQRKFGAVALYGGSDLTEIAILCAAEHGIAIVAIVDGGMRRQSLFNIPVVASLGAAPARPDGAIVTGIHEAQRWYDLAAADLGAARILAPPMLSVRTAEAGA